MKFEEKNKMDIQEFRNGLLRLLSNLVAIEERDKSKRIEEFEFSFNNLISRIEDAKEKGIWRKTYFNLFETLGNQSYEDPHTKLLAWLLNPEESHGIGDKFLREFMEKVFDKRNLPPFSNVKVMCEKRREDGNQPDIVVDYNNGWLVIENKIFSKEGKNQTMKYADYFKSKGIIGENVFLAYVNPNNQKPESPDFKQVSYRIIRELLENIQFQGDANFLISHFINHIFMDLGE